MSKTQAIFNRDIETVMTELGLTGLSNQEKLELMEELTQHFFRVIIETAILGMNSEQREKFSKALDGDPSELESWIMNISSQIPGLAEKIENAISDEFLVIKTAKQAMDAK